MNSRIVHCEETGKQGTLDNNVLLTKIDGVIVFNNFNNPTLDSENKIIKPIDKPPIRYNFEIYVPDDLRPVFGRLFAFIEDEEDMEQSTALMSLEGQRIFSGKRIIPFIEHIKNRIEFIKLPSSVFFPVIDNTSPKKNLNCENWGVSYYGTGNKYKYKEIIDIKIEQQRFGMPGILWPGYDVAVGDCSANNPIGTGYQFKTAGQFKSISLCCNESAVDFCKKNNCIVYYNDFLNDGKLRLLTEYTVSINQNLKNSYLYRSSNI